MNTRTGIDQRILAAISYAGIISGGLIPGLLLILEPENRLIRFHSVQSIILSGIMWLILTFICCLSFFASHLVYIGSIFSCFTFFCSFMIGIPIMMLCIFLAIKAYNEEFYKLPVIGDLAEKIAFRG